MSDLTEMWTELEKYQPYADEHGFGAEWRRMCEERTEEAAWAAASAAAYSMAWAAASQVARMLECKELAIRNIRKAIEQENKT